MAAIRVTKDRVWVGAYFAFLYVVDEAIKKLNDNEKLMQKLTDAKTDGSKWFTMEDLCDDDFFLLQETMSQIHNDLVDKGSGQFSTDQGYRSLLDIVSQLVELTSGVRQTK